MGVATVGVVALVALVLQLVGGGDHVAFPEVGAPAGKVAGTAYLDNGDGRLGDGDIPIAGATVWLGAADLRFAGDRFTSTTDDSGGFVLDVAPGATPLGLFVEVVLPAESPDGSPGRSGVSVRVPAQPGEVRLEVAVPSLPHRCSTPEACAAPLLPDLAPVLGGVEEISDRRMPQDSWSIDTTTMIGHKLLRFSSVTANIGQGPAHVISNVPEGTTEATAGVWQRVWYEGFGFIDRPVGSFVYTSGMGHNHIHVADFERYRLLDESGAQVATNEKISFCLMDNLRLTDVSTKPIGVFRTAGECGDLEQSISPGWTDYYGENLDNQWIDVTDVPPGNYEVEIVVDPDGLFLESDATNNSVRFPVTIP